MTPFTCECAATFTEPREAVTHAKDNLHQMTGLYYAHRLEVEERFHEAGLCTHVVRHIDGARTRCIAKNPIAQPVPA